VLQGRKTEFGHDRSVVSSGTIQQEPAAFNTYD
jgi:hypothetical protein